MKQRDSPEKQNKSEYVCPRGNQAYFSCAQPRCNKPAIKCIAASECSECRGSHNKCPRQIRIANLLQLAKRRERQSVPQSRKISEEDLLQRLISQLVQIKKSYGKIENRKWGIDPHLSSLMFDHNIRNKQGSSVSDLLRGNITYPDIRFYRPPQFRKDVEQVQRINRELERRMLALHEVYRKLAQCDCELKRMDRQTRLSLKNVMDTHEKFRKAITERLGVQPVFAGEEQKPTDEEIKNFKILGLELFKATFLAIQKVYTNKQYAMVKHLIGLIQALFSQDRKQYSLQDTDSPDLITNKLRIDQIEAYCLFELKEYQKAYDYFSKRDKATLTVDLLRILIKLAQELNLSFQTRVEYLLLLQAKQPNIRETLEKIIGCYIQLGDKRKVNEYNKKLNELLRRELKKLSTLDYLKLIARHKTIIVYEEENERENVMLNSLRIALDDIKVWETTFLPEIIGLELFLRYRLALMHRYVRFANSEAAMNGIEACTRYLKKLEKDKDYEMEPIQRDRYLYITKQYYIKFLVLQARSVNQPFAKVPHLEKAIALCNELRIRFFQPFYELAKASFQLKSQKALENQQKANQLYPTATCYTNSAYLLYEKYFKERSTDEGQLRECIRAIERSLALKPDQVQMFHLRGIVNHNLGNYEESNRDFQRVLEVFKTGRRKLDAERRMAQNYEFILKFQSRTMMPDQITETLEKTIALYENCLQQEPHNERCILGYGRVLRMNGKFPQAQRELLRLIDSSFKAEAYMELGAIKEELGKKTQERDFLLLEDALNMYKKGGKSRENLQNLKRIYLELDEPRKAEEVDKELTDLRGR